MPAMREASMAFRVDRLRGVTPHSPAFSVTPDNLPPGLCWVPAGVQGAYYVAGGSAPVSSVSSPTSSRIRVSSSFCSVAWGSPLLIFFCRAIRR